MSISLGEVIFGVVVVSIPLLAIGAYILVDRAYRYSQGENLRAMERIRNEKQPGAFDEGEAPTFQLYLAAGILYTLGGVFAFIQYFALFLLLLPAFVGACALVGGIFYAIFM